MSPTTRAARPIPIALTALVAVLSALAALAVSHGTATAQAHGNAPHQATAPMVMNAHATPMLSAKSVAFHAEMRKLWEDHVTWTRLAIISLESGTPDTDATVARLLRNQTDIGNAVKPFYGAAAGKQLTALLREHILIAADLIGVAQKGDQAGVAAQQARWTKNADEIAAFLTKANPSSWKLGEMKTTMQNHLRLTTDEVVARLQSNWAADVKAYDRVEREILQMSEMLADGLVAQFPSRFA
jgi:hypothetical protein